MSAPQFDLQQVLKMVIKYMIEGIAIALAAYYIPTLFSKGFVRPSIMEIFSIGATAAIVMAILDQYAASVGASFRQGAGLGMGFRMVGSGPMFIPH